MLLLFMVICTALHVLNSSGRADVRFHLFLMQRKAEVNNFRSSLTTFVELLFDKSKRTNERCADAYDYVLVLQKTDLIFTILQFHCYDNYMEHNRI